MMTRWPAKTFWVDEESSSSVMGYFCMFQEVALKSKRQNVFRKMMEKRGAKRGSADQ